MPDIPSKCSRWKVANHVLFKWWCRQVCGRLQGKLCEPWCKVAESRGLWTLWLTLGVPFLLILAILAMVMF